MPTRQEPEHCMAIQDHLSGDVSIDTSAYTDTCLVRKDRVEEVKGNGFVVIKESDNSDLVLMGKAI